MSHPHPGTLIPHHGSMCLLDQIVEWNPERVVLVTSSHRSADNPLRHAGRLRAVHLCEYGAQAMAVHGALLSQGQAMAGMLVSLRGVEFGVDYIDDLPQPLQVIAQCLQATPASQQYRFEVWHAGSSIAAGRAAVMLGLPDVAGAQADAGQHGG